MIDVTFDFTSDSYKYWDEFWDRKDGLGAHKFNNKKN